MQSRKPIAKKFKKEVKEILKSIRKNGMYVTNEKLKSIEREIEQLKNNSPLSRVMNEIKNLDNNLSCAEVQTSVRESLNSVTTTTTVRLYSKRNIESKPINIFCI
ncbi:hypothetical protein [Streptobacillus moniliformis]|uniref:hypothetical protein n=1 Tax=Streptobacillus moniliformis TaxID=34105 RepID=UPI0007E46E7C|nr:hypothetical protein [Streptobacillus moniliformis]